MVPVAPDISYFQQNPLLDLSQSRLYTIPKSEEEELSNMRSCCAGYLTLLSKPSSSTQSVCALSRNQRRRNWYLTLLSKPSSSTQSVCALSRNQRRRNWARESLLLRISHTFNKALFCVFQSVCALSRNQRRRNWVSSLCRSGCLILLTKPSSLTQSVSAVHYPEIGGGGGGIEQDTSLPVLSHSVLRLWCRWQTSRVCWSSSCHFQSTVTRNDD